MCLGGYLRRTGLNIQPFSPEYSTKKEEGREWFTVAKAREQELTFPLWFRCASSSTSYQSGTSQGRAGIPLLLCRVDLGQNTYLLIPTLASQLITQLMQGGWEETRPGAGYHQSMIPWPQSISLQLPFITSASLATMAELDYLLFFFPPKYSPASTHNYRAQLYLFIYFLIKITGGCTRQTSAGGFPDTGVNCSSLGVIAPSKSEELCPSNTVYCYFYVCKSLNIKLNELHAPSSWTAAKQEHNAAAVAIKPWWQQSTPLIPHAQQFVMHESWIIMPLLPSNEAQLPETRVYN